MQWLLVVAGVGVAAVAVAGQSSAFAVAGLAQRLLLVRVALARPVPGTDCSNRNKAKPDTLLSLGLRCRSVPSFRTSERVMSPTRAKSRLPVRASSSFLLAAIRKKRNAENQ